MKHLILTFFAVILCYSLFFDNKSKASAVDEINYIYEDVSIPNVNILVPDTFNYFSLYNTDSRFQTGNTTIVFLPSTIVSGI